VRSAGLVNFAPLNAHFSDTTFTIDGRPLLPPGQFLDAVVRSADPSYFQAIGISAKRGAPGARTVKRLQRGGALGAPEAGPVYHWALREFEAAADWFEKAISRRSPTSTILLMS
jgi:hypothetical protein